MENPIVKLVQADNKVLNLVAKVIPTEEIVSEETQYLIKHMFVVARGKQGDSRYPTLVGLAAPQIGVSKRVVVIGLDATGDGKQPELQAFINPEIIKYSKDKEEGREGCFSTGRVCGIVERSKSVRLRAYNVKGQIVEFNVVGFPARVAQHEIDHLDGIRFPDRINDDSKLHWVEEAEFGEYRLNWQNWPVNCPREKWGAVKNGNN